MPELPEVEVCRQGIAPELEGRVVEAVVLRVPRLRQPMPPELPQILPGCVITAVRRRGKYLLIDCSGPDRQGSLILHLGMSGNLRFVPRGLPPEKHDHFDLVLGQQILRLADPRRFGLVLWQEGPPSRVAHHPVLAVLGDEPLAADFTVDRFIERISSARSAIKPVLMDGHRVVGVGNIYASESLFRAGISPLRAADRISRQRYARLFDAVRETLADAIAAGGSSIRDYVHSDGGAGCFQIQAAVYERAGLPCLRCGGEIRQIRQAGRSTYYCPSCQR